MREGKGWKNLDDTLLNNGCVQFALLDDHILYFTTCLLRFSNLPLCSVLRYATLSCTLLTLLWSDLLYSPLHSTLPYSTLLCSALLYSASTLSEDTILSHVWELHGRSAQQLPAAAQQKLHIDFCSISLRTGTFGWQGRILNITTSRRRKPRTKVGALEEDFRTCSGLSDPILQEGCEYCRGRNHDQHLFETYVMYGMLKLCWERGTIMLVMIQATTVQIL